MTLTSSRMANGHSKFHAHELFPAPAHSFDTFCPFCPSIAEIVAAAMERFPQDKQAKRGSFIKTGVLGFLSRRALRPLQAIKANGPNDSQ